MCVSRPTVYVYLRNFATIGLFCHPLAAKPPPNFCSFWTSAFSDVASWHQSQKVEQGCTTTNLPLSNCIKTVSVLQRLHGEIWRTISDIQKRDEQTDRRKTQRFWPPRRRVKSEPRQTWQGGRGPRARCCTCKTFGGLTHSFAARGAEKLGVTGLPHLKTPITPQPLEQIQRNLNS